MEKPYLIIDWGTSNFRAFVINNYGQCEKKIEKPLGLLSVQNRQFESTLSSILEEQLDTYQNMTIYMAGMVGSTNGWLDCGYIETPASFDKLTTKATQINLSWGQMAYIFPGVSHFSAVTQCHDVMRGEEVQIFGLLQILGTNQSSSIDISIILPGTHSKHVKIVRNKLEQYQTYMTGEFFNLLRQHSILGRDLPIQQASEDAFAKGVQLASNQNSLIHKAFMARTQKLFQKIKDEEVEEFLSGLLIGEELAHINRPFYLVGGKNLMKKYQQAAKLLNLEAQCFDGDTCFLAGMQILKEKLHG